MMDTCGEFYCDLDEALEHEEETKLEPRFHTVLLDDDDHTYEYVIQMLMIIFGYSREKGFEMACEVDAASRVVVFTGSKSEAEENREKIRNHGPDGRIPRCTGSMGAIIEPAGS